jgi:hypothetical protein
MANMGVEMLLERQRGAVEPPQRAPISKARCSGKATSGTLISLMILPSCRIRDGRVRRPHPGQRCLGFLGILIACAVMARSFGLPIAAIGNSPGAARVTLAVLMMVMRGRGCDVHLPAWLQQFTLIARALAVDG